MSVQVEMIKVFSEASRKRAVAVRDGDMSEAWKQTVRMKTARDMAESADRNWK